MSFTKVFYYINIDISIRGGHSVSFRLETALATVLATVLDMLDMLVTV